MSPQGSDRRCEERRQEERRQLNLCVGGVVTGTDGNTFADRRKQERRRAQRRTLPGRRRYDVMEA